MKNCVKDLPEGYNQVYHINAGSAVTGVLLTLFSLVIVAVVLAPGIIFADKTQVDADGLSFIIIIGLIAFFAVIIVHELIHGAAYKLMTGSKLTFGITWSAAFCGVPDVYVNRRTALTALLAPFVLLNAVFVGLTVGMYFVNVYAYFIILAVLALHTGGCVGDLYMVALLLFRFRHKGLLMRDTGPEQFIYYPADN